MFKTNYLWLIIFLFISSCSSDSKPVSCTDNDDKDFDNVLDIVDNCISDEVVENAGSIDPCTGCQKVSTSTTTKKITNLKTYLEISGSMKGYMPGQKGKSTSFQKDMASLFSWLVTNVEAKSKKFYGIKDDKTTIEFASKDDVASKISRADFSFGATTTLPDLVENVINQNKKEDVSIIVSDFLYSPPNMMNLEGTLNVRLREMFLKHPNMALSVYAFKSDFAGRFYTVSNQTVLSCCDDKRPYYIWVLGEQSLVEQIDKIINEKNINFLEELHVGKTYKNIEGEVLSQSGRDETSIWQRKAECGNIITEGKIRDGEKLTYTIGLNLNDLPNYYKNKSYLQDNLKAESSNSTTQIKTIRTYSEFEKNIASQDIVIAKKYTHFIEVETVRVDDPCKATINLELKSSLPKWIDKWNTESDETDAERSEKSVLLKRIFSGINEAYENKTLFSYQYIITASTL